MSFLVINSADIPLKLNRIELSRENGHDMEGIYIPLKLNRIPV